MSTPVPFSMFVIGFIVFVMYIIGYVYMIIKANAQQREELDNDTELRDYYNSKKSKGK
jgi:Tfp pilus assembly protein PilO|tara:strand:- start:388 stop:561 length:174 start_codon:yes stop_codon:yes gene_type:complete